MLRSGRGFGSGAATESAAAEEAPVAVETVPVDSLAREAASAANEASRSTTSKLVAPEEGAAPVVAPQSARGAKGGEKQQ